MGVIRNIDGGGLESCKTDCLQFHDWCGGIALSHQECILYVSDPSKIPNTLHPKWQISGNNVHVGKVDSVNSNEVDFNCYTYVNDPKPAGMISSNLFCI
jgi:hypothetical protein